jgi:hypothetical protein
LFPAGTGSLEPIDMEVCYWALLFMPLVILRHLLNVSVQLANKKGFKQKKIHTHTLVLGKHSSPYALSTFEIFQ